MVSGKRKRASLGGLQTDRQTLVPRGTPRHATRAWRDLKVPRMYDTYPGSMDRVRDTYVPWVPAYPPDSDIFVRMQGTPWLLTAPTGQSPTRLRT